jgi:hypothetical protein
MRSVTSGSYWPASTATRGAGHLRMPGQNRWRWPAAERARRCRSCRRQRHPRDSARHQGLHVAGAKVQPDPRQRSLGHPARPSRHGRSAPQIAMSLEDGWQSLVPRGGRECSGKSPHAQRRAHCRLWLGGHLGYEIPNARLNTAPIPDHRAPDRGARAPGRSAQAAWSRAQARDHAHSVRAGLGAYPFAAVAHWALKAVQHFTPNPNP